MKEDIHKAGKMVEGEVQKVLSQDNGICQEDKDDLLKFYRQIMADGLSSIRIIKYFHTLKTLMKMIGKPMKDITKDDIIDLIGKIEREEKWSDWTKRDFKIVLKKYYRWFKGVKEPNFYPEEVSWIKATIKNGSSKLPEKIMTEEEIKKLAEAAYTSRDKAFILCLYESGCRIGEFLPLKIGDIEFDEYGCVIRVSGKTGDRRVRLVASSLSLTYWLEAHPEKNNPESYLWCKIPTKFNPKHANNYLTYQFICRLLKEVSQKAQVKKNVNPHSFRHARATYLANKLTDAQMKEFFGWQQSSSMASVYIHLSGRNIDDAIMKIHGIKTTENEKPVIAPVNCFKCKEKQDPSAIFCKRCGTPLDERKMIEIDKAEDVLIEFFQILGEIFPESKLKLLEVARRRGVENLFLRKSNQINF